MHALVYGGSGALGDAIVTLFRQRQWLVTSVDMRANAAASSNVLVDVAMSWEEQHQKLVKDVAAVLGAGQKLDAIVCVAGGWAGGNASGEDLIRTCELMWKQSVQSSVIAARLAALYLREGGLLSLTGARAAVGGTGGMIGYGMAKAAVHQLTKSLANKESGMPVGSKVLAILPVTLDTPMNRKYMPDADKSTWTPMNEVAEKLLELATKTTPLEPNGQLLEIVTVGGKTAFNVVG